MEKYIVDSIRKIIININFITVFSIHMKSKNIYDNGLKIDESVINKFRDIYDDPKSKNELLNRGLKIGDIKFVIIEIIDNTKGITFIHAKSDGEGNIAIIGKTYTLNIRYDNELVPMYNNIKIEKLKDKIDTFNLLLA